MFDNHVVLTGSIKLIYAHVFLSFSVLAKVELSMNETVDVYIGDMAEILCQYTSTNSDSKPRFLIQWFVVSENWRSDYLKLSTAVIWNLKVKQLPHH